MHRPSTGRHFSSSSSSGIRRPPCPGLVRFYERGVRLPVRAYDEFQLHRRRVMVSLSFLVENASTAVLVILYLFYEIHHGRLERVADKVDEVIVAVIALAQENDDIDEDEVADRLNGSSPDDLRLDND